MNESRIQKVFFAHDNVCATRDFNHFLDDFQEMTDTPRDAIEGILFNGQGDDKSYSALFANFECGHIAPSTFFRELTIRLGCANRIDFPSFANIWMSVFVRENHELCKLLHNLTTQKSLLANTNIMIYARYMARSMIVQKHFGQHQNQILSFREKTRKPGHEIYHRAIASSHVQRSQAVLVDACPDYVESWITFGGHGILYDARKHKINYLEKKLSEFGVLR